MLVSRSLVSGPSRRPHACRGARRGNSIIEMAIVLNLLMWVSMGMVEFGEFVYIRHSFEAAARDGARYAVLATATPTGLTSAISRTLSQANVTYSSSWLTMTYTDPVYGTTATITDPSTVPAGDEICVLISTTYGNLPQASYVRPLYSITGHRFGIPDSKVVSGQSTFVK